MDGPLVPVNLNNGNGLQETLPSTIDPLPLIAYLSSVLKPLFGATEQDLNELNSQDTLSRLSRFAQEPQVAVLYIQKIQVLPSDSSESDEENGANGTNGTNGTICASYMQSKLLSHRY